VAWLVEVLPFENALVNKPAFHALDALPCGTNVASGAA
jgi:hypothetical protein